MTPTEQYISTLAELKSGDLGLLRTHAGQGLDESVNGFDLFTGLWWPLRARTQRAPRRAVAWLVAKLYAFRPLEHLPEATFAKQLSLCQPREERERERFRRKFDRLLVLSLDEIEPALQWALERLSDITEKLDWVRLTDDLSVWERENTRRGWAGEFLQTNERV